mgnify:CR=1 FL=1
MARRAIDPRVASRWAHLQRNARAAARMTQGDLAIAAGTDRPSICRYEQGLQMPSLSTACAIALVLDIDLNDLQHDPMTEVAVPSWVGMVAVA